MKPSRVEIVLIVIIITILLVILGGTSYTFLKSQKPASSESHTNEASAQSSIPNSYVALGIIRIAPKDKPNSVVIVNVAIPRSSSNLELNGEIERKLPVFREVTRSFFEKLSLDQIKAFGEISLKKDLVVLFNNNLELGSLNEIWFSDYLILE